jgi:hypothetical protein
VKSVLVEFARLKNLNTGILRAGDDYLCSAGPLPVRQVAMNVDQLPFNKLMKSLRYEKASEERRRQALDTLAQKATELLDSATDRKDTLGAALAAGANALQQIDFVANAAELSAMPFEAALAKDGKPLFLSGGGVVFTRRVRGAFVDRQPAWPIRPRVLFAWSSAGGVVPQDEHRRALLDALEPWLPARLSDRSDVLVEIGNAKLRDIKAAVDNAANASKGFTHVHMLAHGTPVAGDDDDRFGVALNHPIEGVDAVKPEDLAKALTAITSTSVVVTLAACDLANATDSINPAKSVAHELHVSGIPVVIASQLPLTIDGSIILATRFYRDILGGRDVRAALHATRVELYENSDKAGHDWVSLVGYVQLNEGYADFLKNISLQARLASLENLRDKAVILAGSGAGKSELASLRDALKREIRDLEIQLASNNEGTALDENVGLLGSAEKRLAEFCFAQFYDENGRQASREALERALKWYRRAFKMNPSHHWSAVQYLALDAALNGKLDRKDWKTAYRAAEVDRVREAEFWAHGSLVELALLGRIIDERTDETAEVYLAEMRERVGRLAEAPRHDPFTATRLQLRRYVDWWRQDQGFFAGTPDLASDAARLADLLQAAT